MKDKVRIGITTLTDSARSGTWTTLKNLIKELKVLDTKNEYVIYVDKTYDNTFGVLPLNYKLQKVNIKVSQSLKVIFWHMFILPFMARIQKLDVLYIPAHNIPIFIQTVPTLFTIQDLNEYLIPNHYGKLRTFYRKLIIPISSRNADRIIAVSNYTRKKIESILSITPDKILVVYHGIDKDKFSKKESQKNVNTLLHRYKIKRPFILYVGQIKHPNKNLINLIKSYNIFKQKTNLTHSLVLSGKLHRSSKCILEEAARSLYKEKIIFTGYIHKDLLPDLYNLADLFVYIPHSEGFGLPVLEAMSCGVPVISSNTSCFPEIIGDAGILVDPNNITQIADAIAHLIEDMELRNRIIDSGYEKAKHFSWRDSAVKMLGLFETSASHN